MRAVGELAGRVGAKVLIDEVYLDAAVPPRRSAVHLGDVFVTTNSLTKVYGLSGLRCGWILAEPELAERMWRLNDLFGVNQAHQAERLACIAFDHLDEVAGDNAGAARPQPRALQRLRRRARRPGVRARRARHHRLPALGRRRHAALDDLLRERYDTAVVAGRWFEMPDHFRVGFGLPEADFRKR